MIPAFQLESPECRLRRRTQLSLGNLGRRDSCLREAWPLLSASSPSRHPLIHSCASDSNHFWWSMGSSISFLGIHCDVCLDATAHAAIHEGYCLTVVPDCTVALHLPYLESLTYLGNLCAARLTRRDNLVELQGYEILHDASRTSDPGRPLRQRWRGEEQASLYEAALRGL